MKPTTNKINIFAKKDGKNSCLKTEKVVPSTDGEKLFIVNTLVVQQEQEQQQQQQQQRRQQQQQQNLKLDHPYFANNRSHCSRIRTGFGNEHQRKSYLFLKSRVYLLSSLIGDRQPPNNIIKGKIGLVLWILNLCIHFSVDFYEAATVFHVSWATSVGVFFVMLVICTVSFIRHTVKWFVKILKKLCKDKIYDDTIKWLHLFFKYSPYTMGSLSVMSAAGQYGCYAYDGALTLKFPSKGNGTTTNVMPFQVEVILNIVRFTSLTHIYYMMFLLLIFAAVVFFTIVHSQKAFNKNMANELKAHPPSMTFQDAVDRFAVRTKLLRGASENTTVIFSTILVATSLSFVVNAYNFLFIKRYAIYIWFAIAPLVWTVSILVGAALVTSSFQKLKLIVMQSWVEIPEKYDEMWSRAHIPVNNNKQFKIKGPDWKAGLENIRLRKAAEKDKSSTENLKHLPCDSHVITIDEDVKTGSPTNTRNTLDTTTIFHNIGGKETSERKVIKMQRIFHESWAGTEIPKVVIHPAANSYYRKDKQQEQTETPLANSCHRNDKQTDAPSALTTVAIDNMKDNGRKDAEKTRRVTESSPGDNINSDDALAFQRHDSFNEKCSTGPEQQQPFQHNALHQHTSTTKTISLPMPATYDSYSSDTSANEELRLKDLESLKTTSPTTKKKQAISKLFQKSIRKNHARKNNSLTIDGQKERPSSPQDENKPASSIHDIVRVAQSVNRFKNAPNSKRKFNYEKYIKFLELTLDTIGFSLGKMTITWDRVSFFIVLLLTLVGVFAQNAFLK